MGKAPSRVRELVEQFQRNRDDYRLHGLNETQLRREYLDPFFESLGWDITNRQGHAPAYQEVIHEDVVKVGGVEKAPDYSFRIGGTRKFFVEAKNPSVNLKESPAPAYQLRRYAWSAKLPLSILTDFEEFVVYDCRARPAPTDKTSVHRSLYLTYDQYDDKWEEVASIFSKDAILKGSFDKYAAEDRKRGTATVDAAFLADIEDWREMLAKNLALRNTRLAVHDLNFAVQRTIDRIIFLRICEDRGAEHYGQLQALLNGEHTYGRLKQLFRQADDRYNSGIFHFEREAGRAEAPDELTLDLSIDDKVLKDIIVRLYAPKSPYEFSVFPIEILGQVYEQFLGKVIRLTAGHQAKVEEKPEVKKAGGVYYTPAYIVDYIVKQTVGVLCQDKLPKQISSLRILDPACGSGSFLIGAYQYLLTYHRDWYVKAGPDKHKKELYHTSAGDYRLTSQEKKRILLNNIYGVDIDPQAVEVTKLSLLLKVLEGESDETLKRQLSFVKERALPDLGQNIKCGNSLIGPDYFTGNMFPDEEEMRRINPFDWNQGFPEIMKVGGFDAVIGNPPYGALISEPEAEYLVDHHEATTKDLDTYALFMEKALRLCKFIGKVSMIVPTGWYSGSKFSLLRRYIARVSDPESFVNLPYAFFSAWVDTSIFVLVKRRTPEIWPRKESCSLRLRTFPKRHKIISADEISANWETVDLNNWFSHGSDEFLTYADAKSSSLITKIVTRCKPMGEFADIQRGVTPFELTESARYSASRRAFAGTVRRYTIEYGPVRYIKFDNSLAEPKPERYFKGPRLLIRELISRQFRLQAVKTEKDFVTNKSMQSVLKLSHHGPELDYVLGLVNSRLLSWYFLHRSNIAQRDDFPKIVLKETRSLPLPPMNLSNPADKAKHDTMVTFVERMLDLHKRLAAAKNPNDQSRLQSQIDGTDHEIDRLVYDLYGLTEDEIAIVEGTAVASEPETCEDVAHEDPDLHSTRPKKAGRQAARVAKEVQHTSEGGGGSPQGTAGPSEPVHGVREPTRQYGSPEDPLEGQGESGPLGSTRYFDTAEGRLSYSELSDLLAVPLVGILDEILQTTSNDIKITAEWLCVRHKRLAGHLFPDWAGRFRDLNVQVGAHTPPPFYEVPILVRQFCDDLAERLQHVDVAVDKLTGLLAWTDWRFQWIHPFKDFNGRIGRVLLAALLFKLSLPHVETAPLDDDARASYLAALRAADAGNFGILKAVWYRRLSEAL